MYERLAKRLVTAFFVFWLGGVVGVLLDLDHLLACLAVGKLPSPGDWSCGQGRPAHIPGLIVSFVVFLLANALLARLCAKTMMSIRPRPSEPRPSPPKPQPKPK